ncbi:hypothetical protein PCC6912_40030 [Chlorogloeopsis fritschii PCC 6912]|uniref:Uncharacterized protein n=1 Tax=Chlorogloeopsis fritschii PCC 6912 TaxID=211165 RepID=A0A433N6C8_CHLFR|nr:hypothetical protein [Chlorogloeopsis fritschii]RUR77044.1 hypothetical protein PCC6912_40030 [Chlorogloeopsis fritschii PCC 6912]
MLSKWFGGMFGDNLAVSHLRVGSPTVIQGDLPSEIASRYSLPVEVSAKEVLKQSEEAGKLKATEYLHAKLSRHKLSQLQSLATMYKNQLAYSKEAMNIEADLQREKAHHGQAIIRHAFGNAEKQRELNGYEKTFKDVESSFNF